MKPSAMLFCGICTAIIYVGCSVASRADELRIKVADAEMQHAIDRAELYDQVQVYQRNGFVRRAEDGLSINPNRHKPWRTPGGTDAIRVKTQRFVYFPEGTRVTLWATRKLVRGGVADYSTIVWRYPVGTVFGEVSSVAKLGAYELRTRRRTSDDWVNTLWRPNRDGVFVSDNYDAPVPAGYVTPQNCTDCHRDTGVDQSLIKPRLAGWLGHVRGSDGIFSWSPLAAPKPGFKLEPALRKEAEKSVRILSDTETPVGLVKWLQY